MIEPISEVDGTNSKISWEEAYRRAEMDWVEHSNSGKAHEVRQKQNDELLRSEK